MKYTLFILSFIIGSICYGQGVDTTVYSDTVVVDTICIDTPVIEVPYVADSTAIHIDLSSARYYVNIQTDTNVFYVLTRSANKLYFKQTYSPTATGLTIEWWLHSPSGQELAGVDFMTGMDYLFWDKTLFQTVSHLTNKYHLTIKP